MQYKLIGLDLDGTLLNSNQEIDKYTIEVIHACLEKNIKIVLASGRLYPSMEPYVKMLKTKDEQISLNGAAIINPKDQSVFREKLLPFSSYKKVVEKGRKHNIPFVIFDSKKYYCEKYHEAIKDMEVMCRYGAERITSVEQIEYISKALFISGDMQIADSLKKTIDTEKMNCLHTGFDFIEVFDKTVSKGWAIQAIAEEYEIMQSEILTIGDSENDYEMIEYAGTGIAMGNAYKAIKTVSDYVTDINDCAGVAKALYRFVL